MRRIWSGLAAAAMLLAMPMLATAQDHGEHEGHGEHAVELPKLGVVMLVPTKGNKVRGMLRLMQQGEDLKIVGKVRNLTPGEHGFHIHEFGDLRGTDGKAAGGHFNPYGHDHGGPGTMSHVGDLGNIVADENGVATVEVVAKKTPLHFVLGRSFVVHAGKDDMQSQPSGAAGPRVATGVVGIGNPEFKVGGK